MCSFVKQVQGVHIPQTSAALSPVTFSQGHPNPIGDVQWLFGCTVWLWLANVVMQPCGQGREAQYTTGCPDPVHAVLHRPAKPCYAWPVHVCFRLLSSWHDHYGLPEDRWMDYPPPSHTQQCLTAG
jgi:hypothetical protein